MKRFIFLVLLLLMITCELAGQRSQRAKNENPKEPEKTEMDSSKKSKYSVYQIPFIDSFRTDSLRQILARQFQIQPPTTKRGKVVDPFDPFLKENYIRKGLGKFWFFIINLLVIGVLLYFRNAFPNQLPLRMKSLFNRYHFRELVSDTGLTFTSGSIVATLISTMVMAQALVIIVISAGYIQLNSIIFYILVFFGLLVWRVLMFFLQSLESYILNISQIARSQTQRQINVDIAFAMLLFPIITVAYFNASLLQGINVSLTMAIIVTSWIGIRIFIEFLGLLRESSFSLSSILYFCAFEIMPHAVLISALFRRYNN